MNQSFKNRNILVLVFEILVISLGVGGITFATSRLLNSRTTTIIMAGEYNVEYVGEEEIKASELEPISDSLIGINSNDKVIRVEFSLRGVKENDDPDLIYDVMLSDMNIDCSLLNEYTKWNLYKNGNLISSGSLDPKFDGNVLGEYMRLTNTQEDLPEYNEEYDKYVLIFWISESCDNLETCKLVDQSNIINSSIDMKVFIAVYSGEKTVFERVPSNDNSCANRPSLYDNMVPITYVNGEWVVADVNNNNKDYSWYDYGNSKWANAVVVNNPDNYSDVGKKISNDDVLGYFVWIPRYRYKLWNVSDELTDSYHAYDNGIDIIFEGGLSDTPNTDIINDNYITHPAFSSLMKGFWVSKYEMSKDGEKYKFIMNKDSYRSDTLENYKSISNAISTNYKLGDTITSNMISNLEWGAILYLSHSKYGVCNQNGCDRISLNNSYISGNDKQDTTTRNVYGVYDMGGASGEYALGNASVGTATSEVMLADGTSWSDSHGILNDSDYFIRGGIGMGMFSFVGISMDYLQYSTRITLYDNK